VRTLGATVSLTAGAVPRLAAWLKGVTKRPTRTLYHTTVSLTKHRSS